MSSYALLIGDFSRGFTLKGPFDDYDAAERFNNIGYRGLVIRMEEVAPTDRNSEQIAWREWMMDLRSTLENGLGEIDAILGNFPPTTKESE